MSNPYRHPISTPVPELAGKVSIASTPTVPTPSADAAMVEVVIKGPLRFVDEGHPLGLVCYDRDGRTVSLHPAVMGAVFQVLASRQPVGVDTDRIGNLCDKIDQQAKCLEGYAESHGFSGKAPASAFHWQATHFRDLAQEIRKALPAAPATDEGEAK